MMSYWRRAGLSLKETPAAVRSLYACLIPQRTVYYSSLRPGSEVDSNETEQEVPLDPEWVELAKKQLKGADPKQTLTWRTAEVS